MGKYSRDLERPREPHARDRRRRGARDIAAIELDAARGRRQEVGQQVEAGRLACTIGPDQGVNRVSPHRQVDVLYGDEALELFGQTRGPENCFFCGHTLPLSRRNKSDLEAAVQHWRPFGAKVNVRTGAAKTACWRKTV